MLRKKERLKRADFSHFFSLGKRTHTPYFTIVFAPHTTSHGSVVVSKKIARKAVDRNKLRRRIYDILRRELRGDAPQGVYILLVKKDAVGASHGDLLQSFKKAIRSLAHKKQ